MQTVLQSRTTIGLLTVLAVGVLFAALGKLTPELVDLLKWAFFAFSASRAVTNVSENFPRKPDAP